jgi:hypothetical protein
MKTLAIIVKPESLDYMILSLKETGLDATIYYIRMKEPLHVEEVAHLSLHILQEN